jgi:hypothetical protein
VFPNSHKLILSLLILIIPCVHAEKDEDGDDEILARRLGITIAPLSCRLYSHDRFYYMQAGLHLMFKKMSFDGTFESGYEDMFRERMVDESRYSGVDPFFRGIELGASYHILSSEAQARQWTMLGQKSENYGSYEKTTTTYGGFGGNAVRHIAMRAGARQEQLANAIEGIGSVPRLNVYGYPLLDEYDVFINPTVRSVYIGLGIYKKAAIEMPNRLVRRMNRAYADFMFAPSIKHTLVDTSGNPYDGYYSILTTQRPGFRVGAETMYLNHLSLMAAVELGMHPGVYEYINEAGNLRNFYISVKVGLSSGWF